MASDLTPELEAFVRDEEAVAEFLATVRFYSGDVRAEDRWWRQGDMDRILALLADRDAKLAAVREIVPRIIEACDCPKCYWNGGIEDVGLPPPPGTHDPSQCPNKKALPTLPEGWPTLQEIMRATADLANGNAPDWHVNHRLTNAASFAITAYPALVALVERWRESAAMHADPDMVVRIVQEVHADELAALLALAKEETK